jgi:hypothetical protein
MTSRQLLTAIGLLAVLILGVVMATLGGSDESTGGERIGSLPSAASTIVKPDVTSRTKIVSRLREILRVREEAYRSRNSDLLESVYSSDCPCLLSDRSAIDEMLRRKRVWDGVGTSIEVRAATKLSERVWTITGLFRSKTLYVRTEEGSLVETEPAGRDLFMFTLVKPQGEQEWLLGLVSILQSP